MTFDDRVTAFSRRFLTERTFELIVSPALADFQYDADAGRLRRAANYLGVLRAVVGGMREDLARESGTVLGLFLLPVCYHAFLIVLCADLLSLSSGVFVAGGFAIVLSAGPVMVCYWPERQPAPPAD